MPFKYKETHQSKRDGSPAMLVTQDPFVLINEDGYWWQDDATKWAAIEEDVNA